MFPSGVWRGYWEQTGFGRQLMGPLELHFADGKISGQGNDCIGPFTFSGRYDKEGRVTLIKQYLGRHQVLYQGQHDGEGTIFGQWTIGQYDFGPFALTPDHTRPPPDAPIQEL
jgi:hypothetical protein